MNRFKWVAMVVLILSVLGGAVAVSAQGGGPPPRQGGGPGGPPLGGVRGEVTAVGADSLTVRTAGDETVTVNVTADTRISILETGSDGALSDIVVGAQVQVDGRENDDGAIDARLIRIVPAGDSVVGVVTAVDGSTLIVEDRRAETGAAVTISDATKIVVNGAQADASAITTDKFVQAFGETQSDGSLAATWVIVQDRPAPPSGTPGAMDGPGGRDGQGPPPPPRM